MNLANQEHRTTGQYRALFRSKLTTEEPTKLVCGRIRRRVVTAVVAPFLAIAAMLFSTAVAAAEGEAQGSAVNLTFGETFPVQWHDDHRDGNETLLHLINCSSNPEVVLLRYEGGQWQETGPRRVIWCLNTDGGWHSWGVQTFVGWYTFAVVNPRSANDQLNVDYYHFAW